MTVEEARNTLIRGGKIVIVVGTDRDDPTIELSLEDGVVMSRAVAGWSEGVVEPVCALDSDFLRTFLLDRHSVRTAR